MSTMFIHPKNCVSSSITKIPICIKDNRDYRKLALKLHPDKNSDCIESATEKFKILNNNKEDQENTYGILSKESFNKCIKDNENDLQNYDDEEDINSFDNALNKYYELKSEYNERVREHKNEIRCINCNQKGKSIFTTDMNENNLRVLKAICGCQNPCNLNIELVLGSYANIFEEIEKYKEELKQVKNAIIIYKNDIMFDANKQADTDKFTELKTKLNEIFTHLNKIYDKLYEIENTNEDENIKELKITMNNVVSKIKEDVLNNEYDNAVKIYIDELEPILTELREKTYAICEVDKYIEKIGITKIKITYTLIQEKYLSNTFVIEIQSPEIISFITKRNGVQTNNNDNISTNNNDNISINDDDKPLNMKIIFENSTKTAYLSIGKFPCNIIKQCVTYVTPLLKERPEIKVFNKIRHQQRFVGFFSNDSKGYSYSGMTMPAIKMSESMTNLLNMVNKEMNTSFNGILVNKYMNGNDYIGAHSDDESGLDPVGVVAISYGAERMFRIRDKITKKIVKEVKTTHCSIMHMGGNFQQLYTHEIPIEKNVKNYRISFTFRKHNT